MRRATIYGVQEVPRPRLEELGQFIFSPARLGWNCWLCVRSRTLLLTGCRRRSSRGRKEVGIIGQASWISSIINLVNTSMRCDLEAQVAD